MEKYIHINQKLLQIKQLLHEKSVKRGREIINITKRIIGEKEYKTFKHKHWYGIIILSRNMYMGTIISIYNGQPFIIRGYPKIKYANESLFQGKNYVVENKYDGTNLGCFILPDGKFMCKTRRKERGDFEGYQGIVWMQLLKKCDTYNAIEKCCKMENVTIFGELYGKMNQGEFVKYDVPIDFKVFDIIDMENYCFMPRNKIENLASKYGFNIVEVFWKGIMTFETVKWLEEELKNKSNVEGFVAKTYIQISDKYGDRFFCKIKSEEIKLKCFKISRATIPTILIREAVKKVRDNAPLGITRKEFYDKVVEELKEEAEEELIRKSKKKIWRIIEEIMTYQGVEKDVANFLKMLESKGYNLKDKKYVMRALANMFIGVKPSTLYLIYKRYLKTHTI